MADDIASPEPVPAGRKFEIRFPRLRRHSGDSVSYLTGTGEIAFSAEQIRLSGRIEEFLGFGSRKEFSFPAHQVVDVFHSERTVRFDIVSEGAVPQPVQFLAKDEAAARVIAQLLPATVTEAHAREVADLQDFENRLQSAGGKPRVVVSVAAINVAVFVVAALAGAGVIIPDLEVMTRFGTNYGPLTIDGQWWRLLTCTFLHFGILHLALNMWALVVGGSLVERLYGSTAFLLLYLAAGLCGSLSSLLWNPAVNSAGASGAIFGVYGALLAFFLRKDTLIPAVVMRPQRASTITFIGYNLVNGLGHAGIDNAAHIGGLVSGLVLGFVLARPLRVERRSGPQAAFYLRGLLAAAAIIAALAVAVLRVSNSRAPELTFRRDLIWLEQQEQQAIAAQRLAYRFGPSEEQAGEELERDVIPRWEMMERRFSSHRLPPDSRLRPLSEAYLRYISSRLTAVKALASSARNHSNEERARANQLFKEGDEYRVQIGQLIRN